MAGPAWSDYRCPKGGIGAGVSVARLRGHRGRALAMRDTMRIFVAVEVAAEVRARAQQLIERLKQTPARVKWVEPHNLHLTLKFLGDVEMGQIPSVCRTVTAAAAELPPFSIEVAGVGAFPTSQRPRTVWLGVGQGNEEMVILHDYVEQKLAELGFRREGRRFQPHLTIGRVRSSPQGVGELGRALAEHRDFVAGRSDVSELAVFSSELSDDGPTYEALSYAPLVGA